MTHMSCLSIGEWDRDKAREQEGKDQPSCLGMGWWNVTDYGGMCYPAGGCLRGVKFNPVHQIVPRFTFSVN